MLLTPVPAPHLAVYPSETVKGRRLCLNYSGQRQLLIPAMDNVTFDLQAALLGPEHAFRIRLVSKGFYSNLFTGNFH